MFEFIPFKKEHIYPLLEQTINIGVKKELTETQILELENLESYTGVSDGEVVCCCGVMKCWEGRGFMWTIFSEACKKNFISVFRAAKKAFAESDYNRIEMAVPYEMTFAKRRAEMLGFKMECERARKFLPNGTDATIYAWVRD